MNEAYPHLHIVLLCEESGARLWPVARPDAPACLAPVEPGSRTTLLSATVARVRPYTEHPMHVVTTQQLAPAMEDELLASPDLAACDLRMLVTPLECGSTLAIALATARIRREDPSAVVAVFPTNQIVEQDDRWQHLMYRSYLAALQDQVVVVGTQQDQPCAGSTFVHRGARYEDMEDTFRVRQFSADAPALLARRARREGALWHTGILFARAAVLLGELSRVAQVGRTDAARASNRVVETANFFAELGVTDLLKDEAREFVASVPETSVEKGLLEAAEHLVVLSTTIEFFAVRDLADFCRAAEPDAQGNQVLGDTVALGCRNTTVLGQEGRTVVTVGMRDCIVVDTGAAVLVASKAQLDKLPGAAAQLEGADAE